ncbi:polysaccharide deacetylase family protein [Burkholderia thailandensis MSMB121]|uniref:polysaccharide deacetylase family protein n=1 Tax=Burkholderia humptydooensis TaxID=430531 RepID=UPI000327F7D9|nr:polysaccharide deacetylase family protein [Burkholderia humptydooensis]AGK49664.1 polysaccharide deacetylase family protein [Burkholderia thailandensis MSMB121]ATF33473.1 polysaccharide deacetylase [Burkholderia thailandensis]KST72609.1 polysaccharide deacetylase [Burkholderia humptydooensis]
MPSRSRFTWRTAVFGPGLRPVSRIVAADASSGAPADAPPADVAVLVYHRFSNDSGADPMTVGTATFEAQLAYLRRLGYRIVPLRDIVGWMRGEPVVLPPKAVALTVDEGHASIFDWVRTIALRERVPITLFVYPSAVDESPGSLTWHQLRVLHKTGWFDVQSHAWWHPDLNAAHRSSAAFRDATRAQFEQARARIEREIGNTVDLLAWPFGAFDGELGAAAREAGYVAGFTLEPSKIRRDTPMLTLPRFLMVEECKPAVLRRLLAKTGAALTR